jgi:tetratricopeptide (TPR) repeat protein
MDLLDFEAQGLYFEQADVAGVKELLAEAAAHYSDGLAEFPLLRAYFLAPDSLNVLVALNRFYYYQHRLEDALSATERALAVIRAPLEFPAHWQDLHTAHIETAPPASLTQVRLYLFTLKAVGFLNMRLHRLEQSQQILQKLVSVDSKNRIGAQTLLDLVNETLASA